MILAALAATLLSASASEAAAFFPLVPGTKWHYEEIGGGARIYVDEVGAAVEVDGRPAFPVVSSQGAQKESVFYRVESDSVNIVAYEQKDPLPSPRPVLKVGSGRTRWTYVGETPLFRSPVVLRMTGESNRRGTREVLGQRVDVLEVKLDAKMEADAGTTIEVVQVAIYGRGIGLIEMTETGKVGANSSRRTLKLIKFEPGKDAAR
jgi:hypothetical protein